MVYIWKCRRIIREYKKKKKWDDVGLIGEFERDDFYMIRIGIQYSILISIYAC